LRFDGLEADADEEGTTRGLYGRRRPRRASEHAVCRMRAA
jgi:hypothetical protein